MGSTEHTMIVHVVGEPPIRFHFKGSLAAIALQMRRNLRAATLTPHKNSTVFPGINQEEILKYSSKVN